MMKDLVVVKPVPRRYGLPVDFKLVVTLLSVYAALDFLGCLLFAAGMAKVPAEGQGMSLLPRSKLAHGIYFGIMGVMFLLQVRLLIRMSRIGWWLMMGLAVYGFVRTLMYPGDYPAFTVMSICQSLGMGGWLVWRRRLFGVGGGREVTVGVRNVE